MFLSRHHFFYGAYLLVLLQFIPLISYSQKWRTKAPSLAAYAEIGSILAYTTGSVSLEKRFVSTRSNKIHLYGRFGIGGLHEFFADPSGPGGKMGITLLSGKDLHHLEMELGMFLGWNTLNDGTVIVYPIAGLGYRRQPPDGGILFRAFAGASGVGIGLGYAWQ